MEWHLNIPKILHLYWGGQNLSFLRFLTVKTFMRLNPDWKIILYHPKLINNNITWRTNEQKYKIILMKNCINDLMSLPIEKMEIDFNDFGISDEMSEVHKSDFIRLQQLSTLGGMWSDMDILYIKPMNDLYFNTPENKNIETFYCDNKYGHSIGFLMGCKKNKWFKKLLKLTHNEYDPQLYQTMGSIMYNKHFPTENTINNITPAMNISMDVVYPYDANEIKKLFSDNENKITERTIGVHWYAGNPLWVDFLSRTNGGLINLTNNIIGNLIKNEFRQNENIIY